MIGHIEYHILKLGPIDRCGIGRQFERLLIVFALKPKMEI